MADVFQEVDEMMKQERVEKFWKENGRWIIAFVVLTILGTALMSGYKSWNKSVQEKQTGELIAFLDAEDFPNGLDDAIKDWRGPLKGIALLSAAQKYQDSKNNAEALSTYQKVSDNKDIPAEFRGMGTIMAVRLNEGITADEKLEQLNAVVNDNDSPWRHHAAMESALIQAHQKNDYAAAMSLLDSIEKAELAPASMKEKAKKLGHVYSVMMDKNAPAKDDGEEG